MKRIFILAVSLILLISLVGTIIFESVLFAKKITALEAITNEAEERAQEAERIAQLAVNKENESVVDMVSEVCELWQAAHRLRRYRFSMPARTS